MFSNLFTNFNLAVIWFFIQHAFEYNQNRNKVCEFIYTYCFHIDKYVLRMS